MEAPEPEPEREWESESMHRVSKEEALPIASTSAEEVTQSKKGEKYHDGVLPISSSRLTLLYISLCAGMFLSILDSSIVATALFSIGREFGALTRVTWVALAYTLTYIGWSVPFASVADIIGRRSAYLLAFGIFLVFSLACGWAPSLEALIAFRTLQGIGGAGLYSLTMVIFPEITRPDRSSVIGALAGGVVAIAGVVGPVLGGVVTHYATWRWVFWLNGPVALPAMVIVFLAWPKPEQLRAVQKRRSWREMDFVGSLLLMAASILVVYSFQQAGIDTDSWGNASFLAPLLVGIVCWGLLFAWQWYVGHYRREKLAAVFPWHLLKRRIFVSNLLFTLLMGFPYLLVLYALPLRFQIVNQTTSLLAGVWLLPMLGGAAIGSFLAGMMNRQYNRIVWVFGASSLLLTLGTALLTTLSSSSPQLEAKVYGFELLVGLGFGLGVANSSIATSLEASLRDAAVAQGIVAQARILGGSLGIAASTAILGSTQRRELAGVVSPADVTRIQSGASSGLSLVQLRAIQVSYADAFSTSLKVCAAVSGVAILAAAATYRKGKMDVVLRRKEMVEEERERVKREMMETSMRKEGQSASVNTDEQEHENDKEKEVA